MIALNYVAAAFALFIAGSVVADRAGFDTIAKSIVRCLTILALAYLAMLAVIPRGDAW